MSMMLSKRRNDVNICHKAHVGKIKMVVLVSFIGLLVGCASQAGYQRKLDRSVGMSKQELISEWGEPLGVYENKELYNRSGKLVRKADVMIHYFDSNHITTPATITLTQMSKNTVTYDIQPEKTTSYWCKTLFWLEKDRVVRYEYEGNCVAY